MKNKYIIYRYTDLIKRKIVYIGIIKPRKQNGDRLRERIIEHFRREIWSFGNYKVDYFTVNSRTDAEFFEAHLIALYKTFNYHNVAKSDWGISEYLPDTINWIEYMQYNCLNLNEFYQIKSNNQNSEIFQKERKGVNMYDIYTRKLIRKFENSYEASKYTGLSEQKILSCCRRNIYTVEKECIFRFDDDCEDICTYKIPKSSGKIVQLTKEYVYVNTFKTSQEIADLYKTTRTSINICLNGKGKSSKGYIWMYYEDYLDFLKQKCS